MPRRLPTAAIVVAFVAWSVWSTKLDAPSATRHWAGPELELLVSSTTAVTASPTTRTTATTAAVSFRARDDIVASFNDRARRVVPLGGAAARPLPGGVQSAPTPG